MALCLGASVMNDMGGEFGKEAAAKRMAEMMTEMTFDQIRKLAELHDAGILTDEEFTAKKTEILARV